MSYSKGNFYHEGEDQVIDGVSLENCTLTDPACNEISIGNIVVLSDEDVPTATVLAPAGSLYVATGDTIGLYINKGTAEVPDWKAVTTA